MIHRVHTRPFYFIHVPYKLHQHLREFVTWFQTWVKKRIQYESWPPIFILMLTTQRVKAEYSCIYMIHMIAIRCQPSDQIHAHPFLNFKRKLASTYPKLLPRSWVSRRSAEKQAWQRSIQKKNLLDQECRYLISSQNGNGRRNLSRSRECRMVKKTKTRENTQKE